MQINLKPYYWLLLGIVVMFVLIGIIGNVLIPGGVTSPFWRRVGPYVVFSLFLLFGASLVPISLKGFLVAQHKIGNADLPMIQLINQHSKQILIAIWLVFGLGVAIALPVMMKDGFFSQPQAESPTDEYGGSSNLEP